MAENGALLWPLTDGAAPRYEKVAWCAELLDCLHATEGPDRSFVSIATVRNAGRDPELAGRPAVRTVDVHQVAESGEGGIVLRFWTDLRSGKVEDAKDMPFGEICWLFWKAGWQFRFSGSLKMLTEGSIRNELWGELNEVQRSLWLGPGRTEKEVSAGKADGEFLVTSEDLKSAQAPSIFCVGELVPDYVEALYQKQRPFKRTVHRRNGTSWNSQSIHL